MSREDKAAIAQIVFDKLDDNDASHYDFFILNDHEFYKLSDQEEKDLEEEYTLVSGASFMLYYKMKSCSEIHTA